MPLMLILTYRSMQEGVREIRHLERQKCTLSISPHPNSVTRTRRFTDLILKGFGRILYIAPPLRLHRNRTPTRFPKTPAPSRRTPIQIPLQLIISILQRHNDVHTYDAHTLPHPLFIHLRIREIIPRNYHRGPAHLTNVG